MTFLFYACIGLFVFISILLSLVILMQESKSMGLGASFGGDPGESVFGTSTADVLKKFTAYLAIAFAMACVFLSIWTSSVGKAPKRAPIEIEETQGS